MIDSSLSNEELVACIEANTLLQWDRRDVASEAARELSRRLSEREAELDAVRDYIAGECNDCGYQTCLPDEPSDVVCPINMLKKALAAAREAVKEETA